jgi:hypothetical protein
VSDGLDRLAIGATRTRRVALDLRRIAGAAGNDEGSV